MAKPTEIEIGGHPMLRAAIALTVWTGMIGLALLA
jgi:hypothetical protein